MVKKRILLTGDDGYTAIGTRLLVHFLHDSFDLSIAGTKRQQSGVGGHKHITGSGAWGEETVDGVHALWLDGSPADTMEAARVYFSDPFDFIISGINWGVNIGGSMFSSGTFSAAFYGVNLGLAPRAIVLSWDVPTSFHFRDHTKDDDLGAFLKHPGETAATMVAKTLENDFWGAPIVNINLPEKKSTVVEVTMPVAQLYGFWPDIILDRTTGLFSYGKGNHASVSPLLHDDIHVLARQHISLTPCQATLGDSGIYTRMKKEVRV